METFKSYLASKGYSEKVIRTHERHLAYFVQWCQGEGMAPEQANYRDLLSYIQYLQRREVKQRTAQLYINSLKHYFRWMVKVGESAANPARNIDIKGVKRKYLYDVLTMQELEHLYHHFELPAENGKHKNQNWFQTSILTARRNKVMLGLMIWQGVGTTELARLETGDLRLREGKIRIPGSRKSNERELKLAPQQVLDLMDYTLQTRQSLLARSGRTTDQLFISHGGGRNAVANAMGHLMKQLQGINPRVTSTHQLRASVITHWLKMYNLREVQYMAGHRYVSSTESYLVNDLDDLQEDVGKFHPIG